MSEEKKNKQTKKGKILLNIMNIIAGLFIGLIINVLVKKMITKSGLAGLVLTITFLIISTTVFITFNIIIHELGHLIFGLITGYKFVSFRVGSLMLKKEKGKFVFRKFKLPGTAGQCLMMPDENWNAYDYPYILYNLGGVLANIIVSLLSLVLFLFVSYNPYLRAACLILFTYGTIIALSNGIPMKVEGITNDGYNILDLKRDKHARRALYLQLHINGLLTDGIRIKDMPEEYFELPENADLSNHLIAAIASLKCDYLHDKMEFSKAKENSMNVIENVPGLAGIHKNELTCELLFYELIGSCREGEINRLLTDELKKYVKKTLIYVSRRRLTYAYEIFVNHDSKAAKSELEQFEKATKSYPFPGIIEAERELIEFIDNLAVVKNIEMS